MRAHEAGRAILQVAGAAWVAASCLGLVQLALFVLSTSEDDGFGSRWWVPSAVLEAFGIAAGIAVLAGAGAISRRLARRFEGGAFVLRLAEVLVGLWCLEGILGALLTYLPWWDTTFLRPLIDEDGRPGTPAFHLGGRALLGALLLVGPARVRSVLVLPRTSERFPESP